MWGVIDIGSNTVRLVIYSLEDGKLRPMLNKKYAVGLAGYIDCEGRICEEGTEKLLEILSEIRTILNYVQVENIFPFGTASLRNSTNGREIVSLIQEKCGFNVQILTGEEEAVFDYYGATNADINSSGLLVDVGGGSTELAFFQNQNIVAATSIPIGSLNLYKRFVDGLLPTQKEAKQIKKEVRRHLQDITLPEQELTTQPIYSVGGTARASLKLINHQYRHPASNNTYTLLQLKELLSDVGENSKKLLDSILHSSPERIHTVIPGLLIFASVAKFYHSNSFVVSNYGVREGYLMHTLQERGLA